LRLPFGGFGELGVVEVINASSVVGMEGLKYQERLKKNLQGEMLTRNTDRIAWLKKKGELRGEEGGNYKKRGDAAEEVAKTERDESVSGAFINCWGLGRLRRVPGGRDKRQMFRREGEMVNFGVAEVF